MGRGRKWIVWLFVVVVVLLAIGNGLRKRKAVQGWGKKKIALISIQGIIVTGQSSGSGFFSSGTTGSETVLTMLRKVEKRADIVGVLLRMNTPGGTVAGSQEIYHAVQKLRKKGKKVVVSMADICASGGYYVASAADTVFANPGTLTGSIGAILMFQSMEELYKKIGVSVRVVKSGKYKDIGSPFRPMKKEERQLLQGMITDVYDQFVTDVASGRKSLNVEQVRALADGRIYTGRQAFKKHLVDKLGNIEDAMHYLAIATGIKGKPFIEKFEEKKSFWEQLFSKVQLKQPVLAYPVLMALVALGGER